MSRSHLDSPQTNGSEVAKAVQDGKENIGFARLEALARSRGLSIDMMVRELIELERARIVEGIVQFSSLSPRQKCIFEHLKSGMSAKEIGHKLNIKEETVRTHILRLRNRLNCRDLLALRFS